jgi:hypothetical protein
MPDDINIKSGDVISAPTGPFWPKGERIKISQAVTALCNIVIKRNGSKDRAHISGRNLVLELKDSAGSDSADGGTSAISYLTVVGFRDESLKTSGVDVVLKPPCFRPSVYSSQTNPGQSSQDRLRIDGLHTYTPTSVDTRIDGMVLGGVTVTWNEMIWPPYFVGEIIAAAKIQTSDTVSVWQDLNIAGRQWGWIDTICYQGTGRQIVNLGSKPYGGALTKAAAAKAALSQQTVNIVQTISMDVDDPNVAEVFPVDKTKGAMYYQDSSGSFNVWLWSIHDQSWFNIIR